MNNRIKKLRIESGLTQMELAEKVGLTQQAISWLELGKREPSFRASQVIADYFDVPIDYLMGVEHFARKYELWSCSKCEKIFLLQKSQSTVHIVKAQNSYVMGFLRQSAFRKEH